MLRLLTAGCLVLSWPLAAWAHEGHGKPGEGHTVRHYLLEPIHFPLALLGTAIAVMSALLLVRYLWKRSQRISSQIS